MKLFTIRFNEFFDRSISTRSAIVSLFNFDRSIIEEVVLDFSEISLISASAAHQIIIEARKLEESSIRISMINLDDHVKRMLELSRTDRKNILTVQNFERFNLRTTSEINKFLLSFQ